MVGLPTYISDRPLFRDPEGQHMPAPRWRTLFVVLDGSQAPAVRARLKQVQAMHDIPITCRIGWITAEQAKHPGQRHLYHASTRRLRAQAKSPKYSAFYPLQPLISWAFSPRPAPLHGAKLLDTLLIQLKLTTMMRSADVASVTWALFHLDQTGNWQPDWPL